MRKIWMPVVAIVLSAAILLCVYNVLYDTRISNQQAELTGKLRELLPGSTEFVSESFASEDACIQFVYRGETGFVIGTRARGYAGDIDMLIGVSSDGAVTGLQIRNMEETPGLGAEALTNVEFLSQLIYTTGDVAIAQSPTGVSAVSGATSVAETSGGKEIDALTGATVTSKAIVRSVNSAVAFVTGSSVSTAATSWGG